MVCVTAVVGVVVVVEVVLGVGVVLMVGLRMAVAVEVVVVFCGGVLFYFDGFGYLGRGFVLVGVMFRAGGDSIRFM